MVTGKCHAELTHSSGCQRRTNQHRRRQRERAKKIQSALPFLTHTLLSSTSSSSFFWLSHFLCHVACGYICFSISICQSFRCFSCSFTKLELTVLCDTVQFSSVRYGFEFGSVPLWTYYERWLDCECCHVESMNVNAPRQLQQQQQQQSHVTHHNHKANIIIIIIIIAISIIIIIIVTVIVVRF